MVLIEGSLEAKLPTIWTDGKALQLGRSSDVEKIRDAESQKREDAGARKGREVGKQCGFPVFCGSGVSKSRLAKAAGAEPARQMKDEKLRALWREAHLQVKMYKTKHFRVGSLLDVKIWKKCTPSPSTFESKKCENT